RIMEEGLAMLANGGAYVQIGAPPAGAIANITMSSMSVGKRIISSRMYKPQRLPMLLGILARSAGKLPFDKIVSTSYPLADVHRACAEAGGQSRETAVTRAILVP